MFLVPCTARALWVCAGQHRFMFRGTRRVMRYPLRGVLYVMRSAAGWTEAKSLCARDADEMVFFTPS